MWATTFQGGAVVRHGSRQSYLILFHLEIVLGKSTEIFNCALFSLYFCLLGSKIY